MNDSNYPMNVAVVGVGRMGGHHARTYSNMDSANLLAVVDGNEDRAATVADNYGCNYYTSVEKLIESEPTLQAATIAVPTIYHVAAATPLLQRGIACLIEKPLAPSSQDAKALCDLAAASNAILQVGHTERFNPAVRKVLAMDVNARFMEIARVSPMTFRSLDVSVVMDMMIHDIDIALTLAKSPLKDVQASGVSVLSDQEDIANARLVFESGCVANITASRLAMKTERKIRVFSETAYLSLDYQNRSGITIQKSDNDEALQRVRQQIEAGADLSDVDYSDLVNIQELDMDDPATAHMDPLTFEQTDFLNAIATGGEPEVTGQAGYLAVAAAEQVIASIRGHHYEGLTDTRV